MAPQSREEPVRTDVGSTVFDVEIFAVLTSCLHQPPLSLRSGVIFGQCDNALWAVARGPNRIRWADRLPSKGPRPVTNLPAPSRSRAAQASSARRLPAWAAASKPRSNKPPLIGEKILLLVAVGDGWYTWGTLVLGTPAAVENSFPLAPVIYVM
jgi:hypothetical protein